MRAQGGREVVKAAEAGDEEAMERIKEVKTQQQASGSANGKKGAKKRREDAAGTPPLTHAHPTARNG